MGTAEIDTANKKLLIYSHLITYGHAANETITAMIREEIETMWNEPVALLQIRSEDISVEFRITAAYHPTLLPEDVFGNINPVNNYFRIEEIAAGNISFVDGLGCNTGYFKLENLYQGSTTAAHEYGHTLGLKHPENLDLRGKGVPGIMYPRGTLVDTAFQYNPEAIPGDNTNGGTMHPKFRKVLVEDILLLKLHKLNFENRKAVIGEFSSLWHPDHGGRGGEDFTFYGV